MGLLPRLLRPRHMAATAAVFLLTGGVVLGVASAADRPEADPWSAPFGVPEPRVGDRGRYELVWEGPDRQPGADGYWGLTLDFEWLADGEGYVEDASVVRTNRLRLVETVDGTNEKVISWVVGRPAAVTEPSVWARRQEDPGGLLVPPSAYERNSSWVLFDTAPVSPPCGLRNLLQGAALDPRAFHSDPNACFYGPGSWDGEDRFLFLELEGPVGQRHARTQADHGAGTASYQKVEWREDIPYPLAIDYEAGPGARFVLVGFERGTVPIASEPVTLRGPPPPVEWTPRPQWGMDDTGSGLAFPIKEAWTAAKGHAALAELLVRSPDAYLGLAQSAEIRDDNQVRHKWYMVATDGKDNVGVRVQRSFYYVGATELLGTTTTQDLDGWEGGRYPAPAELPLVAPTAASLLRAFRHMQPDAEGLPAVGFDQRCPGCGPSYSAGTHLDLQRGTLENTRTIVSNALHFDQDGRPKSLETDIDRPVAPDTPDPKPAMAAVAPLPGIGKALLTATTAATGSAVLAALLYWLWPMLKAGPVALFTRVRPDRVLEHPQRTAILQIVEAEPGLHRNAIVARLGASRSGTDHHLRKLVAAGLLRAVQSPKYVCYVPASGTDRRQAEAAPLLRSDVARRLVAQVRASPGLSSSDAARALGVTRATLHYHVDRLRRAGILESTPAGNSHRLQLTADGAVAVPA